MKLSQEPRLLFFGSYDCDMKIGDIVKLNDKYAMDSHKGHCGVVSEIHFDGMRAVVIFPMNTGSYYINMLELISESR